MSYTLPDFNALKPRQLKQTVAHLQRSSNQSKAFSRINLETISKLPLEVILNDKKLLKAAVYFYNESAMGAKKLELLEELHLRMNDAEFFYTSIYRQLFFRYLENPQNEVLRYLLLNKYNITKSSFRLYLDKHGKELLELEYPQKISQELVEKFKTYEFLNDNDENNYLTNKYRLNYSQGIYQKIIDEYIFKIIPYKTFFESSNHFINLINNIEDTATRKKIYSKIIEKIPIDANRESHYWTWIKKINNELGPPYSRLQHNWLGIQEEIKRKFNSWIQRENLELYFLNKDPSRRYPFWKQYHSYIKNLEFFEEANRAVLMLTFRGHLIVEFLQINNATYVYKLNSDDDYYQLLNNIQKRYIGRYLAYELKFLKKFRSINYSTNKKGWVHTPGWEWRFEYKLRELGYKKGNRI